MKQGVRTRIRDAISGREDRVELDDRSKHVSATSRLLNPLWSMVTEHRRDVEASSASGTLPGRIFHRWPDNRPPSSFLAYTSGAEMGSERSHACRETAISVTTKGCGSIGFQGRCDVMKFAGIIQCHFGKTIKWWEGVWNLFEIKCCFFLLCEKCEIMFESWRN